MALRYSTWARTFMAGISSYRNAFQNGRIEIYTGTQPASADAAVTGTLLCTITNNSQAITAEICASGTITLSGTAGSVSSIQRNGIEVLGKTMAFDTSLTQTAVDIAAQINNYSNSEHFITSSSGAVITITAVPGLGTTANGQTVVCTSSGGITNAVANLAGGQNPVNGLLFAFPAAGAVSMLPGQTWSGINVATGTAGWYRQYGSVADAGALDTALQFCREDGAVGTSGAEMNFSSTAFVLGAPTIISGDTFTVPTL